jgi:hypothetical protein
MALVRKEFRLPEWAFLDADILGDDTLEDRTVVLHVRSASVIEMFAEDEMIELNPEVMSYKFEYKDDFGVTEKHTAVLHFCQTLDTKKDQRMIIEQILRPTAEWYCRYLQWEDRNIIEGEISQLN